MGALYSCATLPIIWLVLQRSKKDKGCLSAQETAERKGIHGAIIDSNHGPSGPRGMIRRQKKEKKGEKDKIREIDF
jgi:hypothetical protein